MKLPNLKDMDKDELLGLLGLSTKPTTTSQLVESLATFGVGLLVGAGVALLLAPKPGRELRQEIRTRITPGGEQTART
jgi:YtxH-like protein